MLDGRYDYIETGSLISIKKNVKDILIPSEEHRITGMYKAVPGQLAKKAHFVMSKNKVIPIEVKSSAVKNHESIDRFEEKYHGQVGERYLVLMDRGGSA